MCTPDRPEVSTSGQVPDDDGEPTVQPKTWPCMNCGKPIRVREDASLGSWRYEHVNQSPSSHIAVRGPKSPTIVRGSD